MDWILNEKQAKILFLSIKPDISFVVLTGIDSPINTTDVSTVTDATLCNISNTKDLLVLHSINTSDATYTTPHSKVLFYQRYGM